MIQRPRAAAALAAGLLFAGCGLRDSNPASDGASAKPKNTVLRIALTDPDAIDPMKASNRSAVLLVKQLCDTLISFDPQTGVLKPAIAESWTVSPDAKQVTLKLRPNVKFHNGRNLVAEDFVWSLSRFAHPKNGSPQHYLLERVVGYSDVVAEKTATLKGVRALDQSTLQIDLSAPFAEFPAILASPLAGVAIPKEAVEPSPDAFASRPVCTGPYEVETSWAKGRDTTLVKSDDYYAENSAFAGKGAGAVKKIVVRSVINDEAGYGLLEKAQVDIANVPLNRLAQARRTGGRVASGESGHVAYIGFPVTKAPFDKVEFRKALALSINRQEIIGDLLAGTRRPPGGFLPAGAGPSGDGDKCEITGATRPDLTGAKQALSGSGIDPAAVNMKVYLNTPGGHEKWLEKVLDQWESGLGIQASLSSQEWPKYVDFLAQPGPDGPFRLAWSVKFPSAESLYGPLFSSGSLDNFMRFSNSEFDDLISKARSTVDDKARSEIYRQAGDVLCREIPIAPMWFGQNHVAFGKNAVAGNGDRLDIYGDPIIRELSSRS